MQLSPIRIGIAAAAITVVGTAHAQMSQIHSQRLTSTTAQVTPLDSHWKLVLDNKHARALRVELAPTQRTKVDAGRGDSLIVSLGPSAFDLVAPFGSYHFDLRDGEMQIVSGGPHEFINSSDKSVRIVELQLAGGVDPTHPLCGLSAASCPSMRFGKSDQGTYEEGVLFETAKVKVLKAQIGPGGTLNTHTHQLAHVLVPLSPAQCELSSGDTLHEPGNAYWYPELGPVMNRGSETARFLVVELK